MKTFFITLLAVFAACPAMAEWQAEVAEEAPVISIVAAPRQEAPRMQRVMLAFELAQSALGRHKLRHMHIALICADEPTARAQGVPAGRDILVMSMRDPAPPKYYVWIAGEVNDARLAMAFVALLKREWQLNLSGPEIDEAANRVRKGLDGVISARELSRAGSVNGSR